ncbi:HCP-like protein [Durotheca rogersii]|uniref:HCP-like protein n=1 Tax=Durotheca rogersii TaxID=419775 RepID=UPI002220C52C|nr:HCP-like protein [Durotheca rogersii]KAI5862979.1 HCP-like protein [Durotheca rogersii]
MRPSFVSVLLLLRVAAVASGAAQPVGAEIDSERTTSTNSAVETGIVQGAHHQWAPYQSGWELVNEAMANFQKIRIPLHKKAKKQGGILGVIVQYAMKALPSLRASAPPQEHVLPAISGFLLEGVKLLQQSANQNNTDAIYLLAQLNFFGNFSHPRNFKVAFDHYYRLASYGNSSAQYMVGLMYATGLGDAVERDQAKALLYHTFAADAGHTRSEMTVAARHLSGVGVPKNCETANKYYKRVADKAMAWFRSGPPGGMSIVPEARRLSDDVGGVYGEGASVVSSGINALKASPNSDAYAAIDDVIEYLDLMSQKGDFKASFNLGRLYYEGQRGLDRNVDLARRYFATVATMYWRTKDGRTVDQPKPGLDKYASKAAGYIGRMWLRGEGVKQDFKNAQKWFERGIMLGDAQSQWGLGIMNLHGLGMPKNVSMATELFKKSADQDFSLSHVALGALHLDQGTPDDLKIANSYFEAAARWANIEAQYYLAEMMHHGVGRDKTCGMAMAYYKNVAERAEPLVSSWAEANQAYEDGDYELALLDYLTAAEQGYEKAQNNVAFMLDPTHSRLPVPSWIRRQPPRPSLLQNSALALIYWTRSAIQSNIDSLVKMGDYYLAGIGTDSALDKASQCYQGASEYFQSAQALYNLGWMHENGVGLTQDFHLAKRYYDQALETNEEAYLPVTLSLLKLRVRSAWNTFTHGRINSIQDEPSPRKDWSLGEWIANFLQEDNLFYEDEYGSGYYEDTIAGGAGGEDALGDDPLDDLDGVIESLIILGLVSAILFLMYYRARRQQAHRQAEEDANARRQQQPPPQQQAWLGAPWRPQQPLREQGHGQGGLPPQPGNPGFEQWAGPAGR